MDKLKENTALKISNLEKSFVGVNVLKNINLSLEKGRVLGLIGENGAGKSTLMNIIGGIHTRDSGTIEIFGEEYNPSSARDAIDCGISFIHQELNLFDNLSVAENLFIEEFSKSSLSKVDYRSINKKAEEMLKKFDLQAKPTSLIGTLSSGVCQMIEVSKALIKNSKIMIFDEPTTSLSHSEKEKLFSTIAELKQTNISIIYISHILEDVMEICDDIAVLRDGEIISYDKKENYTRNKLITQMVGREISQLYPEIEKDITSEIVLKAEDIHSSNSLAKGMSLELKKSEILGMYGLVGAGRTSFLRSIFGLDKMNSGKVYVNGKEIAKPRPRRMIENGVAFITENRHLEGLLMSKSVSNNLSLIKINDLVNRFNIVDTKNEKKVIQDLIGDLKVRVADPEEQYVESLSGGNQQKVVLGKWLAVSPSIILLDEPTRGVDVGAKYEVYSIISQMAQEGTSVLVVSSEMEELMGICDRILVVKGGKITADFEKKDFNREKIIENAL